MHAHLFTRLSGCLFVSFNSPTKVCFSLMNTNSDKLTHTCTISHTQCWDRYDQMHWHYRSQHAARLMKNKLSSYQYITITSEGGKWPFFQHVPALPLTLPAAVHLTHKRMKLKTKLNIFVKQTWMISVFFHLWEKWVQFWTLTVNAHECHTDKGVKTWGEKSLIVMTRPVGSFRSFIKPVLWYLETVLSS